jgi:hypothetical protein
MADPNNKGDDKSRKERRSLFGPAPAATPLPSGSAGTKDAAGNRQGTNRQTSGAGAARNPQAPPPSSAAPQSRARTVFPAPQRLRYVRAELCPHCGSAIVQPQIAIVCQSCNRFVVTFRLWHGALAVALILAAAGIQAATGQPAIPVAIGLAASQLLLVFAVRPFERHLILIVISFLLVPASVSIVAIVVGFDDALPPLLLASPVWISIVAFLALSVELFVHWRRAGTAHGLSIWQILGTFSIATSAGALLLLLGISFIPDTLLPENALVWRLVQHTLRFRAGALLVWVAYVVLLSLPPTFARRIDVNTGSGIGVLTQAFVQLAGLLRGVAINFGHAVREGIHDILLLSRTAFVPVARRMLFLLAVVAWQVAFSLLIDSYLSYLVDRNVHAIQLLPAALFAAIAPLAIFWTIAHARLVDVLGVATRTVTLTGSLLMFCGAAATLLWWAFELLSARREDVNWVGVASIGIIVIAVMTGFARKGRQTP